MTQTVEIFSVQRVHLSQLSLDSQRILDQLYSETPELRQLGSTHPNQQLDANLLGVCVEWCCDVIMMSWYSPSRWGQQ